VPSQPNGCARWTGSHHKRGYGQFAIKLGDGRWYPAKAHQFAYQLLVGQIPEGLELDHLCGVRDCVSPSHLEPVAHQTNLRRKPQPAECPKGHPFSGGNLTFNKKGHRKCRACALEWQRQARERRKQ
jgi:hypothetical protein